VGGNVNGEWRAGHCVVDELVRLLSAVRSISLMHLFISWTCQTGFPVISAEYEPVTCTLKLEQHRFFSDGSDDGGEQMWYVPINV
jgi:aminopeptidase N